MLDIFKSVWFRVCGFVVAFVGGVFGADNSAQANRISISDYATSSDMSDCDFSRPDNYNDCYRNADGSICTATTVTVDNKTYPYFCLLDWARENRDALIEEIMTDVYGDEWTRRLKTGETQTYTCGTAVYTTVNGVKYYYCSGDKVAWNTTKNDDCFSATSGVSLSSFRIGYSTTSNDVVLHEYGSCYSNMYRLIGCATSGQCLSSGRTGDMVEDVYKYACGASFCSSSGGATVDSSCPNGLDDWGLVPITYSPTFDMCYVRDYQTADDEGNGNLYDATGRFLYVGVGACVCFENDTWYCS